MIGQLGHSQQHFDDSSVKLLNGPQLNFVFFKNLTDFAFCKTCHIIQTIIATQKKETEIVLVALQTVVIKLLCCPKTHPIKHLECFTKAWS